MRDNPYKDLPPLERRPGRFPLPHDPGAEETGNLPSFAGNAATVRVVTVSPLTMGTPAPARRQFLSRSAVSGSAGRSCRWTGRWKRRFSGIRT